MHIPATISPLTGALVDSVACIKLALGPDTERDRAIVLLIRAKELLDDAVYLNNKTPDEFVTQYIEELRSRLGDAQSLFVCVKGK